MTDPNLRYRIHKDHVKAMSWLAIAWVTLQCVGRGIEIWRLRWPLFPIQAPIGALTWAFFAPGMLLWFFLTYKEPHPHPMDAGAPPWAARREDYMKLTIIGMASVMVEFVFKPCP